MLWAIIIVIVIIAAFAVPKFGKFLVISVVALTVIVIILVNVSSYNSEKERVASLKRISLNEVQLVDLRLGRVCDDRSFMLTGRIRNISDKYTLSTIKLQINMRDKSDGRNNEIIGQTDETIYVNVPRRQSRNIEEYIHFSNSIGNFSWDYSIFEISGK